MGDDSLKFDAVCAKDWNMLEKVPEVRSFSSKDEIPAQCTLPFTPKIIGRTAPRIIDGKYWNELNDPDYPEMFQKEKFVAEYFAAGLYCVYTNDKCTQSIPAGVSTAKTTTAEVQSGIVKSLGTNTSIRAAIEGQYQKSPGTHVKATLETAFSISTSVTESSSRLDREEKTINIGAEKVSRLFVEWFFIILVTLYRKKKDGSVQLLAASEWPLETMWHVY